MYKNGRTPAAWFGFSRLRLCLFRRPSTGGLAGEVSVDEPVQVTVHDGVDVAGLEGGTGILDHGVGHKDVGADLAAPFDFHLNALQVGDLLGVCLHLQLHQLVSQHPVASLTVLELGALLLAGNDHASLFKTSERQNYLSGRRSK